MPRPLSRLYSTVSTSPRRTVTDWPTAAETSTSASVAPRALARPRASAARDLGHRVARRAAAAAEAHRAWSGMGKLHCAECDPMERRRVYQQDPAQEGDARAAGRGRGAGGAVARAARAHRACPRRCARRCSTCKRITKHEARRRQMQYIGKHHAQHRRRRPSPRSSRRCRRPSKQQTALFHLAEKWRDELLADPRAIARFAREFPHADAHAHARSSLRGRARRARREARAEALPRALPRDERGRAGRTRGAAMSAPTTPCASAWSPRATAPRRASTRTRASPRSSSGSRARC